MKTTYCLLWILMFLCYSVILSADAMFEEHVIFENTNGACAIAAADFNQDGFQDMVYTCFQSHHIKWLENDGNLNFTPHLIIENFLNAKAIDTGDVDQDGYPDFAATSNTGGKISWFNNNHDGTFSEHVVTDSWVNPGWVLLTNALNGDFIDINSDGNPDILATACQSGRLGWFENDGNQNFTEHIIKDDWTVVSNAVAIDLDGDEDTDILAAAQGGGIVWFENIGDDENFEEHLLFNGWDKPNWIVAGDINNDGFMDFAATSCGNSDAVGWFENDGNQNFTLHLLRGNYGGARCPVISDIDEDGDLDIFSIAWQTAIANFFDNDGNANFTDFTICTSGLDLLKFYVVDLDADGDRDLIGSTAVYGPHHIRWWESLDSFLQADFSSDNSSGHLPLTINFTNDCYSRPPVETWLWDFDGDGNVDSFESEPDFLYDEIGNYNVSLIVSNGVESAGTLKEDFIRVFDGESALEFQSINCYLNVPSSASLNLTGPFTLEAWIQPFDYGYMPVYGNGTIFDKANIMLYLNSVFPMYNEHSLIVKMIHTGDYVSYMSTPPNSIDLDIWQHVALSYDGVGDLHIYLDGVDQQLTEYYPPIGSVEDNSAADLMIGNTDNFNSGFAGVIDEVRIWNVTRTETEICENMNQYVNGSNSSLLGYWRLNEGSGNNGYDLTGYANNGIISGCRWHLGAEALLTGAEQIVIPKVMNPSISNYPNPFNPSTTISFITTCLRQDYTGQTENTEACPMWRIMIYNLKGQKIKTLDLSNSSVTVSDNDRTYSITWHGTDDAGKPVNSGVYIARLKSGKETVSRKMMLIK